MLVVCHRQIHKSRGRRARVYVGEGDRHEDVLHGLGASIMASDSQAMGCRRGNSSGWQTALNKEQRGVLNEDANTGADNARVSGTSPSTPSIPRLHGLSHKVGSLEVGKFADIAIWK